MRISPSKVIGKYWEFVLTKVKIIYAQRIFQYQGIKVKYMIKRYKRSNMLLIVFSACTRPGLKARYNYVKTLDGLKCNRLYILDDYSEDHRGSYYLGHDFLFDEEQATNKLIDEILNELKPEKVVYCGSSKGGFAALNFGLQRKNSFIIAGAPQFFLASYLKASGNLCAYKHIIGLPSEERDKYIDQYLQNRILQDDYADSQRIYLHFSNKEHTYGEHVMFLVEEIKRKNIMCEYDIASYTNHSDISYFFPEYLKKTITKIQTL